MTDDGEVSAVDVPALRAFVLAHLVPGVDELTSTAKGERLTRVVTGPDGPRRVTVDLADPATTRDPAARAWLGLDRDLAPARAHLAGDPAIGPLHAERPDLVVPGTPGALESAVAAVLAQQVSLAAARTFAGRLAAHVGRTHEGSLAFPRAADLAGADPVDLQAAVRVTHARARAVVALARAVVDGLDLGPGGSRADLLAVPGIGAWTADLVDLRCRADDDAYPAGDLALRRALGVATAAEAIAVAEPWRPHRALALLHLWTAHALLPPEPPARAPIPSDP